MRCDGADGMRLPAHTVDISASGTLLEFVLEECVPYLSAAGFASFRSRLKTALGAGFDVTFGTGLTVRAEIVRYRSESLNESRVRVGCRFEPTLKVSELASLRIDEGPDAAGALTP